MDTNIIQSFIKKFEQRIKQNEPLARYTTLKVGGPADLFIEAKTTDEMVQIIREARAINLPFFVLGGGSNILIGDKGIRGLVIKNNTSTITIRGIKGETVNGVSARQVYVEADSGVSINKLVRYTVEEGLAGLEMHLGLPGSVGGAVYMNSKWTKPTGYVGDVVYQAEILTPDNALEIKPKSYFQFGYDSSILQKSHDVVTKVTFILTAGDKTALWNIANSSIAYRRETQPQGVFTAGCTFQNVSESIVMSRGLPKEATSAGFLIDHAGLKGSKINDAVISGHHANFIVNSGKASASDVIQLIRRAKEQVKQQFGVVLEEEIVRVGEF